MLPGHHHPVGAVTTCRASTAQAWHAPLRGDVAQSKTSENYRKGPEDCCRTAARGLRQPTGRQGFL